MNRIVRCLMGVALAVLIMPVSQTANAFTVYNTFAAWQAALSGTKFFIVEDFEDLTLIPDLTITPASGGVVPGIFDDLVQNFTANPDTMTTFTFARDMYAFGAQFNLGHLGQGAGLDVYADSNYVATIPSTSSTNFVFWGFVGDILTDGFTEVKIFSAEANPGTTIATRGNTSQNLEDYQIDNLKVAPVPLPAAAWLLLSGLAGFVALGRRRGEASLAA